MAVHRGPGLRRHAQPVVARPHAPAARPAARRRRSPRASSPRPSAPTAPAPCGSPPPGRTSSGSSRSAGASRPGRRCRPSTASPASARSRARSTTPRCCSTCSPATAPRTCTGRRLRRSRSRRPPAASRASCGSRSRRRCRGRSRRRGSTRRSASRVERLARTLEGLGHHVEEADPHYGLVGLSFMPRSTGGVREWVELHVTDRAQLDPRTRGTMQLGRTARARCCASPTRSSGRCTRTSGGSSVASTSC